MTASIDETGTMTTAADPGIGTLPGSDAEVTDLEQVRSARRSTAKQRRAADRTRDLTALLRDRPDLAGVHAPADIAVEAARWCV